MLVGFGWVVSRLMRLVARLNEFRILAAARRHDVVYLSKVDSYRLLRGLRRVARARLVLDFGDALWLPGRTGARLGEVLRLVDAVTTDNETTANFIRQFNPCCAVIPDCPQVEVFDGRRGAVGKGGDRITIGWIGTPGTAYNLYVVWEALERLFTAHPKLHLRLVGAGFDRSRLPPFERVQFSEKPVYTQSEMVDEVLRMDVGLFPLQDVEASRVRGVLKATVYMAGEAVAVCSPVGQCKELIQDGVNGFLAGSTDEWVERLEVLVREPELRRKVARAGLETVRAGFLVDHSFAKLQAMLVPSPEANLVAAAP